MKIILYQPQIPQNTGNIVRTCAVTRTDLILVEPLGFATTDRWLKRAGLDYWEGVQVKKISDLIEYLENCNHRFFFFSSKAESCYTETNFNSNDALIFGSETSGLPEELHRRWPHLFLKVPMISSARCLNLATTAGIVLYEALRQQGFNQF